MEKLTSCRYCGSSDIDQDETLILLDAHKSEGTQVSCNDCQAEYVVDKNLKLFNYPSLPVNRRLEVKETAKVLNRGLWMIEEETVAA